MSALVRTTRDNFPASDFREQPLLQVRRVYAGFVQGLFYAAPQGTFHWEPDQNISEIIITDENPIQVDVVGKRPAITFTRGPVQFYGLGFDDMLTFDAATGAKKKSMLLPGVMSINCCSRNDLESEYIASVVAEQLWMHRELLMRAGFFEIGRNFVIGAPSPAGSIVAGDSADEWFATVVTSPFHINRTSKFSPLNTQIAREIVASIAVQPKTYFSSKWGPSTTVGGNPAWLQQVEGEQEPLPKMPHPLNPTKLVTVRSVYPNRPGIRQPTIRGRTIPVSQGTVEVLASQPFKV